MASITGKNGVVLEVDAVPSAGGGTTAPIDSLAQFSGNLYIKTGALDTAWAAVGTGGSVTSVSQTVPAAEFAIAGSPVTGAGTLAITKQNQAANQVWSGPTVGAAAQPAFRSLVTADLPAGTGTVTSVALTVPGIIFTSPVSGSPITTSGTLALALNTQSANAVFVGPTVEAAATPTFRALVAADIPATSVTGRLINIRAFTSGTSYTPTAGTNNIEIMLIGGGGGGGGASGLLSNAASGGGGGCAGLTLGYVTAIGAGPFTYAIGAAGAAGDAVAGAGGAGGDTTIIISATTYRSRGGNGGAGMTAGTTVLLNSGGAGAAVGSNGIVNGGGAPGMGGTRLSGTVARSGTGASTIYGGGGAGRDSTGGPGNAGTGFGSGGGGGNTLLGSDRPGGAGASGLMIVWEYT